MEMVKRWLAAFLALLLLSCALAGCGEPGETVTYEDLPETQKAMLCSGAESWLRQITADYPIRDEYAASRSLAICLPLGMPTEGLFVTLVGTLEDGTQVDLLANRTMVPDRQFVVSGEEMETYTSLMLDVHYEWNGVRLASLSSDLVEYPIRLNPSSAYRISIG